MKVIYHNRTQRPEAEEAELGAAYCGSLDDLLGQSDHVVLMLSGNELLMDGPAFAKMKPGVRFYNCRGGLCR